MTYLDLVETVFKGVPWSFVKVPEHLVIILPVTREGHYICITQARPTFTQRVLSPVMGTFATNDPDELQRLAATC